MIWPLVKLGELVTIKGGGTPSKKVKEYWSGNIPWASVKDFKSSEISKTVDSITKLGVSNSATNIIPAGTILTATRMALGKFAINTIDMAINQDLKALFINDDNEVDRDFLIRFLESKAQYIDSEGKGATVKGVTLDFLKGVEIPLPPLDEQKRIAAILDKADAIRRKRQQAINLADDFLRSVFLDMFGDPVTNPKGWEIRTVERLCNVNSGSTPSRKNESFFEGSIPWVKTGEVDGYEITTTEEHISEQALQETSCRLNPKGSIVLAMYGQGKTRGKVGLLGVEAATNQACAVIKPSENINMLYLYNYLRLSYGRLRDLGQGGGQPNLNSGIVKNFEILVPARHLQNKFVDIVNQVNSLVKTNDDFYHNGTKFFNSLSQKAFAGEL